MDTPIPTPLRGRGRGNSQFRGRGGGGSRGRGYRGGFQHQGRDSYGNTPTLHPVPTTRDVLPGAPVSIVLKVDQSTGREVQGFVAEVLTSGDHPRGIKVRLRDGRVGRVQRMCSEEGAKAASEGLHDLGRNGEAIGGGNVRAVGEAVARRQGEVGAVKYSDFRFDGGEAPEREEVGLMNYVVTKQKGKKKGKKSGNGGDKGAMEEGHENMADLSKCPVCGEFEGDEAAVAHHVAGHFD